MPPRSAPNFWSKRDLPPFAGESPRRITQSFRDVLGCNWRSRWSTTVSGNIDAGGFSGSSAVQPWFLKKAIKRGTDPATTQAAFLSSHEPHCAEPSFQRQFRILKNSSRNHRTRMTTGRTFQDASFHSPVFRPATLRAQKPIWPSQRFKIGAAILFAFELFFEIGLIFGIDLCHSSNTTYGVTGVT